MTVDVVDADGGARAPARDGRRRARSRPIRLTWDGRTDDGARAPDGLYRLRIALRRQGRVVDRPVADRTSTRPPSPIVARRPAIEPPIGGPGHRAPGQPVRTVRGVSPLPAHGRSRSGAPTSSRRARSPRFEPAAGKRSAVWDGLVDGAPAPPGTYIVVPTVEDRAGNLGIGARRAAAAAGRGPRPAGRHRPATRRPAAARAGARGRARATSSSTRGAGTSAGACAAWAAGACGAKGRGRAGQAAVGEARRAACRASTCSRSATARYATRVPVPGAVIRAGDDPRRAAGDLLARAPTPSTTTATACPTRSRTAGPCASHPRGCSRVGRTGCPPASPTRSAPLLAFLDRARIRYDVTTDLALVGSRSPRAGDRKGVLLRRREALDPARRWLAACAATSSAAVAWPPSAPARCAAASTVTARPPARPTQPTDIDAVRHAPRPRPARARGPAARADGRRREARPVRRLRRHARGASASYEESGAAPARGRAQVVRRSRRSWPDAPRRPGDEEAAPPEPLPALTGHAARQGRRDPGRPARVGRSGCATTASVAADHPQHRRHAAPRAPEPAARRCDERRGDPRRARVAGMIVLAALAGRGRSWRRGRDRGRRRCSARSCSPRSC